MERLNKKLKELYSSDSCVIQDRLYIYPNKAFDLSHLLEVLTDHGVCLHNAKITCENGYLELTGNLLAVSW